MIALDHLIVVAGTLEAGVAHVTRALGVAPGPGGRHALMATHNRLLSVGPGIYLEVIARDPQAPSPGRRRWYALDDLDGPPRLGAWAVRTDDLDAVLAAAPEHGAPLAFQRGAYAWRMAVRDDGQLPLDGMAPAFLQWQGRHPTDDLPRSDVRLDHLSVSHPASLAAALPAPERVRYLVGAPSLEAVFDTPDGRRTLR